MNIGFDGAGKLLEERLAMVTPQQVKNIVDNVEQVTSNLRNITSGVNRIVLFLYNKLEDKK